MKIKLINVIKEIIESFEIFLRLWRALGMWIKCYTTHKRSVQSIETTIEVELQLSETYQEEIEREEDF